MQRVLTVFVIMFALLAFAPGVAAASPRENFESIGFDAFHSECGQQTCTDTSVFADQQTTASGETFIFACVDQFTFNIRNGRGTGVGGCSETPDISVAGDLSSASLAPSQFEVCDAHRCSTITASAELEGTGQTSSFRGRFTERDGTCTFTFAESGQRQSATGTITFDGSTVDAEGSIRSSRTTVTTKCR
jgi:hypothetical protein